jgi:paired amphipathic helix protein Sin3a
MNAAWRKVFEQNYNKSLDHRSFYFKQADKKALLTKAMLQEVKDAADARRAKDDGLRSLAAGGAAAAAPAPDLAYEYDDT